MATEFIQLSKALDSLTSEEHQALTELTTDKSIVITKADKGNAVVIQDLEDYRDKIGKILIDDGKFVKLIGDQTCKRENRLQRWFRSHKKLKRSGITKKTYDLITPCGSRSGVSQNGIPKIHKENSPIRPIISEVKTYNYKLAKHLVRILTPFLDSTHILTDGFEFINKISNLDPRIDIRTLSFDVVSLFTNVPTLETIEIILDAVFKPCPNILWLHQRRTQGIAHHLHPGITLSIQRNILRSSRWSSYGFTTRPTLR